MTPIQAILDFVSIHEISTSEENEGIIFSHIFQSIDCCFVDSTGDVCCTCAGMRCAAEDGGGGTTWKSCQGSETDAIAHSAKNDEDNHDETTLENSSKRSGSKGKSTSKSKGKAAPRIWDEAPSWQDSDNVKCCSFCSAIFTMMFRKHHCRRCGLVVCGHCSTSRAPLPAHSRVQPEVRGVKEPRRGEEGVAVVRVCDSCVNLMHLAFK